MNKKSIEELELMSNKDIAYMILEERKRSISTAALFKKIIFIAVVIYAIITFIKQQKILNTYETQKENLDSQIAEASKYQTQLNEEKENVNSPEYIETIAREKLDMYLPNERVYIDNEN